MVRRSRSAGFGHAHGGVYGRARCDNRGVADQLFETGEPARTRNPVPAAERPLAVRMRPQRLDELVGQEHLLGEGAALRGAVEEGRPHSLILYGPPGTGKTTIARLIATTADAAFEELSAVQAGRAEVRGVLERAADRRRASDKATVFFLDEIHRFNKAQQDALLPAVEDGLVTLVGATTENPYFEVNSALLSRCRVYELRALAEADVLALMRRALVRGAGPARRAAGGRGRAALPGRSLRRRRALGARGARAGRREPRRRER